MNDALLSDARGRISRAAWPALSRIDAWFCKNGYAGWDPYDLKGTGFGNALNRIRIRPLRRLALRLWDYEQDLLPVMTRKAFGVRPQVNAKALGLLLSSYSSLFRTTGERAWLDRSLALAGKLTEMRGKEYPGANWGYPFDWNSAIFIPRGTPSSVVTATVGDGFFNLHAVTGDMRWLRICEEICEFFLRGLNRTVSGKDGQCFSYTPLDDFRVHNANLFVGEFLARVGRAVARPDWIAEGCACGDFALSEQRPEGFLPYWALSQVGTYGGGAIKVDHYHSGFEIRSLLALSEASGEERFREAAFRYFEWYRKTLFRADHSPKPSPGRAYPLDIHACAEAVLCLATVAAVRPGLDEDLAATLDWVLDRMEYRPGEFAHKLVAYPLIGPARVRLTLTRWGQAWMFRALAEAIARTKDGYVETYRNGAGEQVPAGHTG